MIKISFILENTLFLFIINIICTCLAVAGDSVTPELQARFSTGWLDSIQGRIEIRTSPNGNGRWLVETVGKCPSYPCNMKDYTTTIEVQPSIISDRTTVDGCLVIKLTDEMKITHCPGRTINPTHVPYKLIVNKSDLSIEYGLSFTPYIRH
jgi:hypothetical protein